MRGRNKHSVRKALARNRGCSQQQQLTDTVPGNDNLLKVVGDLLLSSEEKIRTSLKNILFSRHKEGGPVMWDTVKAAVKKEGKEIIEYSDTLEQSKAKPNRSKALWISIMQD